MAEIASLADLREDTSVMLRSRDKPPVIGFHIECLGGAAAASQRSAVVFAGRPNCDVSSVRAGDESEIGVEPIRDLLQGAVRSVQQRPSFWFDTRCRFGATTDPGRGRRGTCVNRQSVARLNCARRLAAG